MYKGKNSFQVKLLIVGLFFSIWQGNELTALPVLKNTEHGLINVSLTSDPNILKVTLNSQMTSINWDDFDIAPGQEVIFNFLKPGSISVNKILAPAGLSSWIQGNITGTGYGKTSYLILSDPNGIQVASTSTVTGLQHLTLTTLEPIMYFQNEILSNINLEMYSEDDYPETSSSTIAMLGNVSFLTPGTGLDLIAVGAAYAGGSIQLGPEFLVNAKSHALFAGSAESIPNYIDIDIAYTELIRNINVAATQQYPNIDTISRPYIDHTVSNEAIAKFPTFKPAKFGEILFDTAAQKYYFNVNGFVGAGDGVLVNSINNNNPNITQVTGLRSRKNKNKPIGYTKDRDARGIVPQNSIFVKNVARHDPVPVRIFMEGFDIDLGAPIIEEIFPVVYSVLINDFLQELYPAIPYLTHSDRKSISKSCTYFAPRTLDEAIALSQRKTPINGNWLAESNELNIDCHTGLNSGPLVLFDINSLLLNTKNKEFFVDEEVFIAEKGKHYRNNLRR